MEITARDRRLFKMLRDYALVATSEIRKRIFDNIAKTTVLRRLRALEREKLIQKIPGSMAQEFSWALTLKGAEVAKLEIYKRNFPLGLRAHDQKLVSLRFLLEDIGIAKSWVPDHEIRSSMAKKYGLRSMKKRLIPDALLGVMINGIATSIALELELTIKAKSRYFKTFDLYSEKCEIKWIWYVVTHKSHVGILFRYFNDYRYLTAGKTFIVAVLDDLLANGLNSKLYTPNAFKLSEIMQASPTAHRVSSVGIETTPLQNHANTENESLILRETG